MDEIRQEWPSEGSNLNLNKTCVKFTKQEIWQTRQGIYSL